MCIRVRIENVLNLRDSDWGGFENYVCSTSNSRGIVEAEVDDQGRYVYKTFTVDGEPTQNVGKSVYQIKVGLKYQFYIIINNYFILIVINFFFI